MMAAVERAVLEEVRLRRAEDASRAREDIVSMLDQAHREDGSRLSDAELRDELVTLLVDGPTSSSLAWAFERLLRHPRALARLREETEAGEGEAYLDAVVRETLRLCPPVPIVVRRLLQPMVLGGYTIPAGATVAPCAYLIHLCEEIYPQPRSFVPERFLDRPPGTYTWIPFGGGVRRCLAASFCAAGDEAGDTNGARHGRAAPGRAPLRAGRAQLDRVRPRSPRAGGRRPPLAGGRRRRGARHRVCRGGVGAVEFSTLTASDARDEPGEEPAAADLLVVGAGAKAAAIATKVHVLNSLGLASVRLTILEATEPAASWSGRNGMTSGEEPLAITPIKDVGFPYESHETFGEAGEEIDRAMLEFSWQQYLIARRGYVRWVNAGSPAVQHRDYGRYLAWVLERARAGVELVHARVTQVSLRDRPDRWVVDVANSSGPQRYDCDALALTGPGVHRLLPHDPEAAPRIFHCDSRRREFSRIPADQRCDIGIVGGGESALSCVAFLRACRPNAQLTIYTTGLPLSRGESFLENRVFSNPDDVGWGSLDMDLRRDFVKHCDRGVFDPHSLAALSYDEQCRFLIGRVAHIGATGDERGVSIEYRAAEGMREARHDYVVNCTGFDLLEQLRGLFPIAVRAEMERRVGQLWDMSPETEVPIGRFLELEGMSPRLHIPGLAALSQGPGFANLGCLGLLANRVLAPLFLAGRRPGEAGRVPTTEVV